MKTKKNENFKLKVIGNSKIQYSYVKKDNDDIKTGENVALARTGAQLKVSDANVLSIYLNEIKKWPLLSRKEEQFFAKTLSESEFQKSIIIRKWVKLYIKAIDWHKLNKEIISGSENCEIFAMQGSIKKINFLEQRIKAIEKEITKGEITYYRQKLLSREKANILREIQYNVNDIDIIRLYRNKTIKSLKCFLKKNQPGIIKKDIIHILRNFLLYDKQCKVIIHRLTTANLRLVVGIAKRYINRGLPLSDLVQEGNIGLLKAIKKFDYRLGNRLCTYASWWIRQSIIRSVEDKSSIIRVPVYINEKIKKISRSIKKQDDCCIENTDEDTDLDPSDLLFTLQVVKEPVSLETPYGEDGISLHECIPDNIPPSPMDSILNYQLVELTEELLKGLSPRDERILRLRFGIGVDTEYTLQEIGETLGVSRERIRQLENSAIRKIKASKQLEAFLPFYAN